MGHNSVSIKADANLIHELAFLSRLTGDREVSSTVLGALSMTADAMQKFADGFVIQIISQSVGRDQFSYPLHPHHMYMDMKQRLPAEPCGNILLHIDSEVARNLAIIGRVLKADTPADIARFALCFAHSIATQLNAPGGARHLAYVDVNDRRFGYVVETPYDKTMRNQFNRIVCGFQNWLGWSPEKPQPPVKPKPRDFPPDIPPGP